MQSLSLAPTTPASAGPPLPPVVKVRLAHVLHLSMPPQAEGEQMVENLFVNLIHNKA